MTRFAVFKDSFVSRLKKFTTEPTYYRHFGKPRMSTKRKINEEFQNLVQFQPDVVFLNVEGMTLHQERQSENFLTPLHS